MKRLLLIVLPLLLIVGCSSPEPINYETLIHDKGGLDYHPETKELYNGEVFSLYMDGKKKFEGTYHSGIMNDWTEWEWYDNGQKKGERTYKNGKKDGLWTDWYNNGQKKEEGNYKDERKNGSWTTWDDNGQKKSKMTYKRGVDHKWTFWYENGQKGFEINFLEDGSVDFDKRWNEDGSEAFHYLRWIDGSFKL
jgi:antitoxin component YwqK of YwqJK toxin-antitoxin module